MFPIKAHLALILLLLASKIATISLGCDFVFPMAKAILSFEIVTASHGFCAGKIPQEAFSAWSKEAQKEKVKGENGEINQKIFAMAEAVTT